MFFLLVFLDLRKKYLYLISTYFVGAVLFIHLLHNKKIETSGISRSCNRILLLTGEDGEI